jgi:capsular polysaccharide biosynthesis protein
MATAFRNKSIVINEVANDLMIAKDRITMAPVMRDLLATVIANSSNGQIYISAERFRDIITIQVQERSNNNGYALASSLRIVEAAATLVGGNLTISGAQQRVATICLSFSNSESVAYDC